ncbi:ABC transporter ATP-binding protein [Haloferax sp. Atlit-12N]|uniref:Probable branched-chain amino acid transport ATP-binding protein LivG n=3 Tax=Haloferax TaxID=2251 RepID=A0A0K1IY20_HALGI|nr:MULTISPECIES: ABC transporter ATP-binding protein [Haloferax]AKU09427.1 branched-chain amino acid ABC transporter substrate-binding protein [Haloferax gibbonsii]ELZ63869.1 branched-chain amino acid ABC transporter ATP-binding protein [Haloferax prahovense DSM 18310]ELZ85347.1 branched-chain amino acid ABC transporter ATP-binding protein [Haloferax gibbonsii ATCC 33959]MCO8266698.1 ABC transporter ATP-binding protein [Haloferax sp. AB510]RDZ40149.1 ABC transporter ATP-binding protein [Halofe
MALLETHGLTKEFGGLTALDGVDIEVEEGELVSLIGPNGAGKSTLINTITGRLRPTEGEVFYAGNELVGMKPFEIAQLGVGRSFQTASILPELTVRENVQVASFAAEHGSFRVNFFRRRDSFDEVQARTNDILETIGLDSKARMEAGSLPYGDKRRLEVAIGLATDPDLLFMDEPTAGMSPTETEITVDLIHDLLADWGMTIFLVEHDMDIVFDVSDRIFTLHQGRLIAQGTPEEIRENPAVREAYLGGGEQ